MRDVLTFILAGGKGERLDPLTRDRAKPAVPFGGIYRIVDFALSNCVNSGLRRIFLLTQYKSFSLQRHIIEGWNIYSNQLGEFVDVVPVTITLIGGVGEVVSLTNATFTCGDLADVLPFASYAEIV